MSDASPKNPTPRPKPPPIPTIGVPETLNEPLPLIANLIKLIRRK